MHVTGNRTNDLLATRETLLHRLKDYLDHSSRQQVHDKYRQLIYAFARKAGLTETEAEDVVQETLVGVARKLPVFKVVVAAASGTEIRILDYANASESESLRLPKNSKSITGLAFLPTDTNVLATVSDQTLRFWDLAGRRLASELTLSNSAEALAFSRDGKLLAAAGAYEETVELWRVKDHSFVGSHHVGGPVFALAFAPDGKALIHGGGVDRGQVCRHALEPLGHRREGASKSNDRRQDLLAVARNWYQQRLEPERARISLRPRQRD